jgi:hypothetical protein
MNMDGAIAAIIAVVGTLLGSTLTYVFQRKSSERAERISLQQQLRTERLTVYSDFGGALTEARRGQWNWWEPCNKNPDSPDCDAGRIEAFRLLSFAAHTLFRVQLVAGSQGIVDAAHAAYELTRNVHRANTESELRSLDQEAKEALQKFMMLSSVEIQAIDSRPGVDGAVTAGAAQASR